MKKLMIIATLLLTFGSAQAFFNNDDMPWNNDRYNGYKDNGIFAYYSYDYFDPRWFSTEFTNMINEVDEDGDLFGSKYQSQPQYGLAPVARN